MLAQNEAWVVERKFADGWKPIMFWSTRELARRAAKNERACGHTVRVAIWQCLQRWA